VAVAFALGWYRVQWRALERENSLTFACIQPNLPPSPFDRSQQPTDEQILDRTEQLTLQAIRAPVVPDLLVWPEAMTDEGYLQNRPLTEAVREIGEAYNGYFLLGSQDSDLTTGKLYNVATFLTPHGDQYEEYRKTRLVVYGEYLPYGDDIPGFRDLVGIHIDFTPGPGPKVFTMHNPPAVLAPLICFEDTLPEVADKAVALHPDFFVTITNDGWYTGWTARWGVRQHLAQAVFRCVEHDRPMIRCANTGISCLIDRNGTVTSRYRDASGSEIDVGGVFSGTLDLDAIHPTLYERWGDWIVLISAFVSVMLGIRFFCRA
jgi:apolipoprotein N-acyltransferase